MATPQQGERYRDPEATGGAVVITVESVSGTTVEGFSSPESTPGVTGVWVGSVDDFTRMTKL